MLLLYTREAATTSHVVCECGAHFMWRSPLTLQKLNLPAFLYGYFYMVLRNDHNSCNITIMMHGCKWNTQIRCPEIDMSSRRRSPSDDISTEGQHIWMFHEQPCFICFVIWPTTSKYKIPMNIHLRLCFTQKPKSKFPMCNCYKFGYRITTILLLLLLFMVALCNKADHIYFHAVVCSSFLLLFFLA